ncbi:hypothetical protein [Caryophanon tenue]|uniref:Flagellar hook-length control protein-like C-terminal domain-containing protein n=1 Tax=Caryophanon tenue TaxID=33978 RepID=A0A1C0YKF3_9BACL|nr:hypothetical protein [Caryophanon tenue]OCS87657.1 hypothetical protein A6M13_10160 [Caryophanon tenue]
MTSMSFQPIQSQSAQPVSTQPVALQQGQMFHGTIKQLYPDQTAEIQVGNQKMIAKLEVPLKQGDAHLFQVTQTQPQTELKVVTNAATPQQQMQQVMNAMNLPKTPEMQQALQHFMKAQLPITKENMQHVAQFLKTLPADVSVKDALAAMTKMIEQKLPMTQTVFQALTQGTKTSGMVQVMQQLQQTIEADPMIRQDTKQQVMQQLQKIAQPFTAQTANLYAAKLIEQLQTGTAIQKEQALSTLKQANLLPPQASVINWQQPAGQASLAPQATAGQVMQALTQATPQQLQAQLPMLKQWMNEQPALQAPQKEALQQFIQRFEQLPKTAQTAAIFTKQFHEQLLQQMTKNSQQGNAAATAHMLSLVSPQAQANIQQLPQVIAQQPQLQQMMLQVESTVQQNVDAKAIEQAMRQTMRDLGMSYEATMKTNDPQTLATQLKPQLLAMLQEPMLAATKDAAETMLARLNGMQLQSGDNGHQHQLVMQVPLQFLGKQSEATLQWNGRMKDDGQIDADYARILFYLQLSSLEETMIDMQVQNRIVTVHVFTHHDALQALATPLQTALKEGLAKHDYQLSGVFLKPFTAPTVTKKVETIQTTGVDYRI